MESPRPGEGGAAAQSATSSAHASPAPLHNGHAASGRRSTADLFAEAVQDAFPEEKHPAAFHDALARLSGPGGRSARPVHKKRKGEMSAQPVASGEKRPVPVDPGGGSGASKKQKCDEGGVALGGAPAAAAAAPASFHEGGLALGGVPAAPAAFLAMMQKQARRAGAQGKILEAKP
jgi:hypothetical protein